MEVWKGFLNDKVSTGHGVREGPSRSQNGSRVGAVKTYVRTHVDTLLRAEAAPVGSEQLGHRGGSEVLGVGLLRRLEDHTRLIQHIRIAAEDAELSLSLCSLLIGRCAAVHLRRERLDLGKHFEDQTQAQSRHGRTAAPVLASPAGCCWPARATRREPSRSVVSLPFGPSSAQPAVSCVLLTSISSCFIVNNVSIEVDYIYVRILPKLLRDWDKDRKCCCMAACSRLQWK